MRPPKTLMCALIATLTAATLTSAAQPAAAATSPVPNSSFEEGFSGGKLKCWGLSGTGTGKLTVTNTGHSGKGAYVGGRGPARGTLKLMTDRTSGCRIPAQPGARYTLRFWMRSTGTVRPVVQTYTAKAGWRSWYTGSKIAAGRVKRYSSTLPAVPSGVTAISVGVKFPATSTVVLDDVTLAPAAGETLFRPAFPATDGLVTNEFAYWSPQNPQRSDSPDWEMTSGSLFARDRNGWTGPINARPADAMSRSGTNSAIFRLTSRRLDFADVSVRLNLRVEQLVSTAATPRTDWDGVHLFLHYKSEYELYYASVARRDGKVIIKKKCRGGPTNGGSYYPLSAEVRGRAIPYGTWLTAGASIQDNDDGTVTINLYRDGKLAVTATDRGVGCRPITGAGAVGIRGDNAQFSFNTFAVTALG
ncbi:hypothetical protein [Actinoplanes sp. N902-109]|uniref:hypothetical protein n=1 Tax=Actinoplanes sp. (strain N902-109) TaxID=649831 RepID=UPI0003294150|nr:hypothetical protein [Actinoplanes sp. N902-109]AGL20823.1 hypothetical protein L083_7313 [Actinoplanes sp. N902-109]